MKVVTMTSTDKEEKVDTGFAERVQQKSGKELRQCYHCQKCVAGCPVSFAMDWTPNQVIRLIQFGQRERVLSSSTIWLCAACEACVTRCPNEVDLPSIMDTLKEMAVNNGIRSEQSVIQTFHRTFLNCLREYGRMHEISLLAAFKIVSLNLNGLIGDMMLAAKMFAKGKLGILPSKIKNIEEIDAIFETFGTREKE